MTGRVAAGYLADRPRTSKLNLLQGVALLMSFAHFASATATAATATGMLVVTVSTSLIAYGASWVLVVSILAEWFGNEHFGKDYGLLAMGPALSGMAMNTIGAHLYDRYVQDDALDDNAGKCIGLHCYRVSFGIAGVAAVTGCFLLSLISRARLRQRSSYA